MNRITAFLCTLGLLLVFSVSAQAVCPTTPTDCPTPTYKSVTLSGNATQPLQAVPLQQLGSPGPISPTAISLRGDLDPILFGAIADGASHLISSGPLLATCPELTAPVETDACAFQAAIDAIRAYGPISGVTGTPGGRIRILPGRTYKLGTQSLVANDMSLTIEGQDQWSSVLLVGANPMLNFGLSNGMGIGTANIASTGVGFVVGDTLVLTGAGGVCEDPPVITVNSVGSSGDVLTSAVTHAGSCSVQPTLNPLGYTTGGAGSGATFSGTFSGSGPFTLNTATLIQSTGTGCVNGEVLTASGGSTPGGSPTQFQLTVTNAISGAIQRGGVSIANPGSYGTPPPNPVSVTGSASCTGAAFNVGALTNSGGSLTMDRLQFVADGAGVSIATAQFNLPNRSTIISDLVLQASGSNYFGGGFALTSVTNGVFQRIDTHNNLAFLNSNPSNALFVIRQQNNLLGHFEHYWDHINSFAFTGGAIDYITASTDTVPFQGLKFERIACGLGAHCLRLENATVHGYGNILIDDLFATQTTQQIEITTGLGVNIINSNFGEGTTRITSPPSQADMVVLTNVNQWNLRGNNCATATTLTPSITCFHVAGTSGLGTAINNIITNAAKVATVNGYVFDSGTNLNTETLDTFGAFVTPIVNSGTNSLNLKPCPIVTLTTTESYTVPSGQSCQFFNNSLIGSATITMPPNPGEGQKMTFTWFGGVTTLTVSPNAGQQLGGAPTTSTQSTPFTWQYIGGRWQRI